MGGLEGAEAVLFSSGMAAAAALLLTNLKPGSVLAMDHGCYHGVRALAEQHLEPRGVEVRLAPPAGARGRGAGRRPAVARVAVEPRARGVRPGGAAPALGVDDGRGQHHAQARCSSARSTSARPTRSRAPRSRCPGHADLMLGYVTSRDPDRDRGAPRVAAPGRVDPGPVRGVAGAPLAAHARHPARARVRQRARDRAAPRSARRRDRRALSGPARAIPATRWPGARWTATAWSCRSTSAGEPRAERFLAAAELVTDATSFGSVHTIAERRARWGGDAVPEGFIRLSAGCEDTADLLADVERALDAQADRSRRRAGIGSPEWTTGSGG